MNTFTKKILPRILIYSSPIIVLYLISFLPTSGQEKDLKYFTDYEFDSSKTPLFYSNEYNISFWGLENLHPFDSKKYSKIHNLLIDKGIFKKKDFIAPPKPDRKMLEAFHSKEYLEIHKSSVSLAHITEVGPTAILPTRLTYKKVLSPMLYAAGGTVLAAHAALDKGWAINLGGGFHHASKNKGHGFCAYNDLTMAIEIVLKKESVNKVLYIDLDAHQGDGPSIDFKDRDDVYILDVFNHFAFPRDEEAKLGIDKIVELSPGETGSDYLVKLSGALQTIPKDFDILIYNAGTDVLTGDPLGSLDVDPDSIIKRDQMVFEFASINKIPIVMTLSGGYQKSNAQVIADSIENLHTKYLISK